MMQAPPTPEKLGHVDLPHDETSESVVIVAVVAVVVVVVVGGGGGGGGGGDGCMLVGVTVILLFKLFLTSIGLFHSLRFVFSRQLFVSFKIVST